MTDTPAKTIQLKGEQWKQLVLLHVAQLQNYLQAIPGNVETGAAGLTDQHMAMIDLHLQEGAMILGAWRRSRGPVLSAQPAAPLEAETQAQPQPGNGAAPKTKGGWPKGRKRTRQAAQPAVTQ